MDNLWVTGKILQSVEGIRTILKMPEEELTKKGIPNLQNKISRILATLTELNDSTISAFTKFSIISIWLRIRQALILLFIRE
jgi:hypothetical protein